MTNHSSTSSPTALECYTGRESRYAAEAAEAKRTMNRYSNWRLFIFIAAVAITIWMVKINQPLIVIAVLITGLAAFIAAIIRHNHHTRCYEQAIRLRDLNREGIQRCNGTWQQRPLQGNAFVDKAHPYSSDLDLFGPHSVFQWFNTARTSEGQQTVADHLLTPLATEHLPEQQTAIKELAEKLDWRQRLEAQAMTLQEVQLNPLYQWAEAEPLKRLFSKGTNLLRWLPCMTAALWIASWLIPMPFLYLLAVSALAMQALTAGMISRSLNARLSDTLKWETEVVTAKALLEQVESENFEAKLNQQDKTSLQSADQSSASETIGKLETIIAWLSVRHNPLVYLIFNSLFLWDLQWMIAVERWRSLNGQNVRPWLKTFASLEARSSLSVIAFENPTWCYPEIQATVPLQASSLGHPLLPADKRISNDFTISRQGSVAVITGSNMSGKTTFLRTIGVNLVLGYTGAPVCARHFACAVLPIYTSMRITDDLSRGVSSFYAELLRIKMIVDAAKEGPVLYLVDEIFRGTNSGDRIAGAIEVLKSLSKGQSVGMVSTHDLELSKLAENEPDKFTNYHFSEIYTEEGLSFSYRIQSGPATTTNARQLIRLVGISE